MPARWLAGFVLLLSLCHVAAAQVAGAQSNADQGAAAAPSPSPHDGDFWTRDALTGDWGGKRSALEDSGILIAGDSIDEIFGNVAGGTGTGSIYDGRLELLATLNLEKLLSWSGATFHANAYQIHGRGLSANYLGGNLMTASNIEATRATRLFDLWIEQVLFDGMVSIRAGQIAADDEFFISEYASSFINGTFGWPAIMATDLPSGGPAYPLATPGLRLNVAPTNEITLSAAVLNGDPAGAGTGDPQQRDASGTSFRFNDGALAITEASYAINQDKDAAGQPATYKLGAWYHTGTFADERFDTTGRSLAAPTSSGVAEKHTGDYGAYFAVDRGLWKDSGVDRNIGAFARLGAAPGDRNLVSLYADTGFNFKGLLPSRTDDVLGIAIAFAQIGNRAQALDDDIRQFSNVATPIRDSEATLEVMYRYQATPWWTLQPDLQFIRHPGGNVALANAPTTAAPNALLLGLRSAILF